MKLCESETMAGGPLVFSNWPPKQKSQSLRHQLLHQLRNSGRIPPAMVIKRYHQRHVRPVKMPTMAHYVVKKHPAPMFFKPTLSTPARITFQSSPAGPHSGEYVYENPFASKSTPQQVNILILNTLFKKILFGNLSLV